MPRHHWTINTVTYDNLARAEENQYQQLITFVNSLQYVKTSL